MKKLLLIIISLLLLVGCQTKEEIEAQKKQEELNKITEEVEKEEISDEAKKWLIDSKTKKMATILCMTTSKKCKKIKTYVDKLLTEYNITIYFYNLDEIEDTTKQTIKTTYELKDFASYTPYIFITENSKLLTSKTDFTEEELSTLLKETKIISE